MIKIKTLFPITGLAIGMILLCYSERRAQSVEEEDNAIETVVSVHVGSILRTTLHGKVTAYGTVELEPVTLSRPSADITISNSLAGIIEDVSCVEGQEVEKGDLLVHMDSRLADLEVKKTELELAYAEEAYEREKKNLQIERESLQLALEKAKQDLKLAEQRFERQKSLMLANGTSQKLYQETENQFSNAKNEVARIQIQQSRLNLEMPLAKAKYQLATSRRNLENAKTQRALLDIRAPIRGRIVRIYHSKGETVDAHTPLLYLIDPKRLVITSSVPSFEIPLLKVGQTVLLNEKKASQDTVALPTGTITFIDSRLDPQTDSGTVRVAIPSHLSFRPGQFVKMQIVFEEHADCLAVPEESVIITGEGTGIISLVQTHKAVQIPVETGFRDKGLIEIRGQGLKEGMPIVTQGAYGLPPETQIRVMEE